MVVVGGLLLIALVVGAVIWVTMSNDSSNGLVVPTTSAPPTSAVTQSSATAVVGISTVRPFDPDPGDGQERNDIAALAIDGKSTTAWTTVCYGDRYLGGKGGVGLIADLGANRTGVLAVDIGSSPYQVRIYAVPDGQNPTTFGEWGHQLKSFNGTDPATVTLQIAQPVRLVLVSFVELGTNNDCNKNRFRGSIREITFG